MYHRVVKTPNAGSLRLGKVYGRRDPFVQSLAFSFFPIIYPWPCTGMTQAIALDGLRWLGLSIRILTVVKSRSV